MLFIHISVNILEVVTKYVYQQFSWILNTMPLKSFNANRTLMKIANKYDLQQLTSIAYYFTYIT